MNWIVRFVRSSLGGKMLMAVTGLMLFGFVIGHLAGNLLIFGGAESINLYAQGLRDLGPFLWLARLGLIGTVAVHILLARSLTERNREARPIPYACSTTIKATFASRSMMHTGLTIAGFVLFHLAHFTWRIIQESTAYGTFVLADGREVHDVYSMVVQAFQNPLVVLTYLAALAALGLHLNHGLSSFFQTLGMNHPRFEPMTRAVGRWVTAVIILAYASIPFAAWTGILSLEEVQG